MTRQRVLFLCVNNSCRSQMAEGLLRSLASFDFEAFSAGSEPTRVHPLALRVMNEIGIDVSGQRSKSISEFDGWAFDFVITVCEGDACPLFTGQTRARLTWSFDDPAAASGKPDEVVIVFRRVRDEIKDCIQSFVTEYR